MVELWAAFTDRITRANQPGGCIVPVAVAIGNHYDESGRTGSRELGWALSASSQKDLRDQPAGNTSGTRAARSWLDAGQLTCVRP